MNTNSKNNKPSSLLQILICSLACFLICLFPPLASAHTTETSGTISGTIHIAPDDDPIIGQQSALHFQFKDKQNKFKPADCDCQITILKNNRELHTQPLFEANTNPSLTNPSLLYTFPERGVYKIKIAGKPTEPHQFQPFTLTYTFRAERVSKTQPPNPQEDNANPDSQKTNLLEKYLSNSANILITLALFTSLIVFAIIQKTKKPNKERR